MVQTCYTATMAQENPVAKTWTILFVLLVYALGGSIGM